MVVGTVVSHGGVEAVFSGSVATETILLSGGFEFVSSGGTATSTTVSAGGIEFVFSGGTTKSVVVSSGGAQDIFGGNVIGTIVSSGGSELVFSGGTASGTVVSSGGTEMISSGGTASGAVIAGGLLDLVSDAVASGSLTFQGTGGTLEIGADPAGGGALLPDAVVSGFATGDTLDLAGIAADSGGSAVLTAGNVLDVVEGGVTYALQLDLGQAFGNDVFVVSDSGATLVTVDNPCFVVGTTLDTPEGEIRVEDLQVGDVVSTLAGPARVRWIGYRRASDVDVIRIRPHALGENQSRRDLCVSDDHAMFLDGVLVPAGLLIDGSSIVAERRERVVFFHVELDAHAVLLAEGAPAESYIDTGNRRQFGNCPMSYDPISAVQDHCAELVLAGSRLDAVCARLRLVSA